MAPKASAIMRRAELGKPYVSPESSAFIRYRINADDFVVTAATKELAEEAKGLIARFLSERGLTLSEEKTLITHIDDGFAFLGWTFRKFGGKLIVKPSKKSVKSLKAKLATEILRKGKGLTQTALIYRLNQILRGWGEYHRCVVSKKVFGNIDHGIYLLLARWAKHRHPNKGRRWRVKRYWKEHKGNNWCFMSDENRLVALSGIAIIRHPRLKITANPFLNKEYFEIRKTTISRRQKW